MHEIERKYLLKSCPKGDYLKSYKLKQFYISTDPEIRIREINDQIILTYKSKGDFKREEIETEINEDIMNILSRLTIGIIVKKERFYLKHNDLVWEIDVYHDDLEGLFVAEVELENESQEFTIPNDIKKEIIREITFEPSYKNLNLAISLT